MGFPKGQGKKEGWSNTDATDHMSYKKYDFSLPLKEWVLENFLPPVFKLDLFNHPESLADLGVAAHSLILWSKKEIPSAFS
jgi:hypothetical protein